MLYRQLGASDLFVSEIALGSWLTYGGGLSRDEARGCIARAIDVGINFFDTANMYANGRAERVLGETLSRRPRESYVLATKLFFPVPVRTFPPTVEKIRRRLRVPITEEGGLSREQVHKQLDASLERLRTDYVDLYQCHRYDWDTPLEETMAALTEVVRAGKVRYLGFSEWPIEKIREAHQLAGVERFVSSQPQYSMIWRGPERDVIPYSRENGVSQIVWSPLAQGVLTGKYEPGKPPPTQSRATSGYMGIFMDNARDERLLGRIHQLREVARELGIKMSQLALAWVLRERNVAAAIVGATRPEQVEENAAASGITVDAATLRRIDEILGDSVLYRPPDSARE